MKAGGVIQMTLCQLYAYVVIDFRKTINIHKMHKTHQKAVNKHKITTNNL